jgi:rhodanese-related sulfurtransferase
MPYRDLTPEEAQQILQDEPDLRLLDVRTAAEHAMHRLPDSLLVPIQEIQDRVGELDPDARWFVYCEHGRRSVMVCEFLTGQLGFNDVTNLQGGMAHWIGRGLPVERG